VVQQSLLDAPTGPSGHRKHADQRSSRRESSSTTDGRRPARAAAPERWAPAWRGRRIGRVPLIALLAWQVAIALVLIAAVTVPTLVVPAAVVLLVVAVLTTVRIGGRPLVRRLRVRRRYALRRRAAAESAATQGFPLAEHDALVPLHYLRPGLTVEVAAGRSGDPLGVIGDGSGFTAVLAPVDEPVVPSMRPTGVGIGTLADLCDPDGVGVDSVQLIVRVQPAPSTAASAAVPALAQSYREVNSSGTAAAVSWLVAVRLSASTERTGLLEDHRPVHAQVRSKADRATKLLAAAGLPCRMLDDSQVLAALAGSVDADRRRPRPQLRRVTEAENTVDIDGWAHASGWVHTSGSGAPVGAGVLVSALSDADVAAATVSVIVEIVEGRRLRVSTFVRLTAPTAPAAAAAMRTLVSRGPAIGLTVVPLTGEQLPGLLATVPLGGGR
jgi:type VII secretion protein EccE